MEKSILIMLDISGTLDGMTGDNAQYFINLLESIKNTFRVDKIRIFFSSHEMSPSGIRRYYNILKDYLKSDIEVETSYYLNGEYGCIHDEFKEYYFGYNTKKVDKLEQKLDDSISWFGIFDDSIDPEYVKKYKEIRPMAVFRPSSSSECEDDNIMCYSTKTNGLNGAIEVLEKYILMLKELGNNDLLDIQKQMLFRLDGTTRFILLRKGQYDLLMRYLKETNCDQGDFNNIAWFIIWEMDKAKKQDLIKMREIAEFILPKLDVSYENNNLAKEKLFEKINI